MNSTADQHITAEPSQVLHYTIKGLQAVLYYTLLIHSVLHSNVRKDCWRPRTGPTAGTRGPVAKVAALQQHFCTSAAAVAVVTALTAPASSRGAESAIHCASPCST